MQTPVSTPPENDSPLFRPEVTVSLGGQWMGAIRLAQPISGWIIAGAAIAISAALLSYITLGNITKKARITGITVPVAGNISIAAPGTGVLITSHIKEGDRVKAGQILFTISTARQNSLGEISTLIAQQLANRQDTLDAEQRLRKSQEQEKRQTLNQRLVNSQAESEQLEQEIGLLKRRQQLAQQTMSKYETLQANGFVSAAQTQQKQEELIDLATRLSNLQRNKTQLQANVLTLRSELSSLGTGLATDLAQLERAKATLKQEMAENSNRQSNQITAPQAGIITTITNQTGQAVNGGQVMATLIPDSGAKADLKTAGIEAHLYAPSRTAGFIIPGQKVLIRYAAYPYQKFGLYSGTVTDISQTPFAPNELPQHLASTVLSNAQQGNAGFNGNEGLYRIKVKLLQQNIKAYGHEQAIKPGMTLEADVMQDRRKIWEWIAEPLLATTRTAPAA